MAKLARKPLQIYLHPDQERALRAQAQEQHVSLAELIRRSIDLYLVEQLPPDKDPSLQLIGLGHAGRSDLAQRHDEIVAQQTSSLNE